MKGKRRYIILAIGLWLLCPAWGKVQTVFGDSTKTHVFTLSANLLTRGEYRQGALPNDSTDFAAFISERVQLSLHYKQPYLEIQITPQHSGVWGTSGGGSFNLREGWAKADIKGFFLKLGRQSLAYDDERVMGLNDWSMTGTYHDALKIGYEGYGHKVHLIGAYCQNNSNIAGGTAYYNGGQPYKNMEALWYHYDFKRWFSGSLLFVNSGLQATEDFHIDTTFYQQMVGTYWRFRYEGAPSPVTKRPLWWVDIDASFYYQFGRNDANLAINAWMAAVEAKAQINPWVRMNTGYFHMSGDENYTVPPPGGIGMQQLKHLHSFNLLYGSKHQFYGAMDFFYLQSFYGGASPGLQDWHLGVSANYEQMFHFTAQYHLLGTSMKPMQAENKLLGHELELTANYRPFKWMSVQAGYTFMQGTKTMATVKRTTQNNQSHWVYLMLVFNPTLVSVRF